MFIKKKEKMLKYNNILYLIKKYHTPIWVYDTNIIKKQIKKLKKFDIIRFAQKSCSNIHILKFMKLHGVKIDAVSMGEIKRALISGFNYKKNEIVFTSDILEENVLKNVIKYKIPVNVGSMEMIKTLGKKSPQHPVWIRINPKFGDGHHIKTKTGGENSKHGIWNFQKALLYIKKYNLLLIGLHMHIGSGINTSNVEKMCNTILQYSLQLKQKIQFISAGGGLNIPYEENKKEEIDIEKYYNSWNTTRNIISSRLSCPIKLEIEPGRFLVAQSGILIAKIYAIKKVGKNNFIILNSGFNDLMRPMLYGSYHKISVVYKNKKKKNTNKNINYIIAGPLCESGDVFTVTNKGFLLQRSLPAVSPGDYIIIHDTGAYGASMSSNYNSKPLISEIMYKNNKFYRIRKRQKIEDLLQLEINA